MSQTRSRTDDDDDRDEPDDAAADHEAEQAADEGVEPHARMPRVLPTVLPGPPHWPTIFGRTAPLEVELGFGRPHFLLERAAEAPEVDIVGIEWKGRWPARVWRQQRGGAYPNVRAVHGNAWLLFGALFPPRSVSTVWINFPDPWWKTKQAKRRIVSDAFAAVLHSRLVPEQRGDNPHPGGRVFLQTDVASLLEQYLERLEAQPGMTNPWGRGRLAQRKPTNATSHREKRCRADGVPVFRGEVVSTLG